MMLPSSCKIYIATKSIDMRKGINGLSLYVVSHLELNPITSGVFVFYNNHKTKLKILYWDLNGFALWYKILERGKFQIDSYIAATTNDRICVISSQNLAWLLSGLDLKKVSGFKPLKYSEFY